MLFAAFGAVKLAAQNNATVIAVVASGTTTATGDAAAVASASSGVTVAVATPPPILPATPVAPRPGDTVRMVNLSTRARVAPDNPLITGFAISGATSRTVLVRAAGPALGALGLAGAVAAPRLRLHDGSGSVLSENAAWEKTPGAAAAIAAAGAFPFAAGSADAAIVAMLAPGNYSAEVIAQGGAGGVALVEIYDVNGTADGSQLSNASTLATVGSAGGGEVISGFILAGTGSRSFLMRGVGPGLTKLGVTGVLSDPMLTVFNSSGQSIAANDDWNGPTKPDAGIYSIIDTASTQTVATAVQSATAAVAVATAPDPVTLASQATGAFALDAKSFVSVARSAPLTDS
jgi:hypothetical protein